jgi:ankyrin repeat protein
MSGWSFSMNKYFSLAWAALFLGLFSFPAMSFAGKNVMELVREGNLKELRSILKTKVDPNLPLGDEGETPLMVALSNGNKSISILLLNAGAKVNYRTHKGDTPLKRAEGNDSLTYTCLPMKRLERIKMVIESGRIDLLEKHWDIWKENISRVNPLAIAIHAAEVETLEFFLRHDVNPKYVSSSKEASAASKELPLVLAVQKYYEMKEQRSFRRKYMAMIRLLLENEADPNGQYDGNFSPLIVAKYYEKDGPISKLFLSHLKRELKSPRHLKEKWIKESKDRIELIKEEQEDTPRTSGEQEIYARKMETYKGLIEPYHWNGAKFENESLAEEMTESEVDRVNDSIAEEMNED